MSRLSFLLLCALAAAPAAFGQTVIACKYAQRAQRNGQCGGGIALKCCPGGQQCIRMPEIGKFMCANGPTRSGHTVVHQSWLGNGYSSPPAASTGCKYTTQNNRIMMGATLAKHTRLSQKACMSKCESHGRCKSAVFRNGLCWLKAALPTASSYAAGFAVLSCQGQTTSSGGRCKYNSYSNQVIMGSTLASFRGISRQACMSKCDNASGGRCKSAVFRNGSCWLKAQHPSQTQYGSGFVTFSCLQKARATTTKASSSNIAFDISVPSVPASISRGSYQTQGGRKNALSTMFTGVGSPFSGCGVLPQDLRDDDGKPLPFVALNFQDTSVFEAFQQPAPSGKVGAFDNGNHCGRWIEISLGDNCQGGSNSDSSVCNGGNYGNDQHSGKTIYGLVADSCGDKNYWCRTDKDHLDISKPYLDSLGMTNGWNGRKVSWTFIDDVPPGWNLSDGLKFAWKSNSKWIRNKKGFYADIIISNTSNGIGSVEQDMGNGSWRQLSTNAWLGQQFSLEMPGDYAMFTGSETRSFNLRVKDTNGQPYGTYRVVMNCYNGDQCSDNTRAPANRVG